MTKESSNIHGYRGCTQARLFQVAAPKSGVWGGVGHNTHQLIHTLGQRGQIVLDKSLAFSDMKMPERSFFVSSL